MPRAHAPLLVTGATGTVGSALIGELRRGDAPAEVQLGGADVLTYREMMRRTPVALGRRPPLIVTVPVLSPRLSSYPLGFDEAVGSALA
jgi:hypothetical protein